MKFFDASLGALLGEGAPSLRTLPVLVAVWPHGMGVFRLGGPLCSSVGGSIASVARFLISFTDIGGIARSLLHESNVFYLAP